MSQQAASEWLKWCVMCCIFDAMRRCFTKRMTRIFALVNSVWISDKVACSERERERVSLLIIQAQQQQAAAVSLLVVIIVTSVNACVCKGLDTNAHVNFMLF